MTKKEQTIANLKKLKSVHNGSYGADIDRAIEALKAEPCEDCVSRRDVFDIIEDKYNGGGLAYHIYSDMFDLADAMPSVTPTRKTGKWIPRNSFLLRYKCSECNCESEKYNFCPNCGAKMIEEEK